MKEIIIATNNERKRKEIEEILNGFKFLTLKDINCEIEVEENEETFEGNSLKKALIPYSYICWDKSIDHNSCGATRLGASSYTRLARTDIRWS